MDTLENVDQELFLYARAQLVAVELAELVAAASEDAVDVSDEARGHDLPRA